MLAKALEQQAAAGTAVVKGPAYKQVSRALVVLGTRRGIQVLVSGIRTGTARSPVADGGRVSGKMHLHRGTRRANPGPKTNPQGLSSHK